MKLAEFVVKDAIVADLKATDRNGVIRELVAALVSAGAIEDGDGEAVAKSIIQRDNQ